MNFIKKHLIGIITIVAVLVAVLGWILFYNNLIIRTVFLGAATVLISVAYILASREARKKEAENKEEDPEIELEQYKGENKDGE